MKPGIYNVGRRIQNNFGLPITHQFLVLVPHETRTLAGIASMYKGVRYLLLGAYNDKGYLRANKFAPSDVKPFHQYLDSGGKTGAQVEPAEVAACFIDSDQPIKSIYRTYTLYKEWEGKPGELVYPKDVTSQFDKKYFNSNSWAQSCLFWGCSEGTKNVSDFNGIDPGSARIIPRKYFVNGGWLYK